MWNVNANDIFQSSQRQSPYLGSPSWLAGILDLVHWPRQRYRPWPGSCSFSVVAGLSSPWTRCSCTEWWVLSSGCSQQSFHKPPPRNLSQQCPHRKKDQTRTTPEREGRERRAQDRKQGAGADLHETHANTYIMHMQKSVAVAWSMCRLADLTNDTQCHCMLNRALAIPCKYRITPRVLRYNFRDHQRAALITVFYMKPGAFYNLQKERSLNITLDL